MAAPKLLDKKTINAEVATQKLQQIKEGITLSKKVDKVRDTLWEEEARLEKFRTESIAVIQKQINAKVAEHDSYIQGNEKLRAERFALQAPIDLKEEWTKVNEATAVNTAWQERLVNDQVSLLADREDNKTLSEILEHKQEKIRETEKLTNQTFQEAQRKFALAEDVLQKARNEAQKVISDAKEREQAVSLRELEATLWENALSKREITIAEDKSDIAKREQALKVKYEVFLRAQNYLKNKNKK